MPQAQEKAFVQRHGDRRTATGPVTFPLLDSDFNIVRKDRRAVQDRHRENLKLIDHQSQPIWSTTELHLEFNGRAYNFDKTLGEFVIGRSKTCDLAISHELVSRKHVVIRYLLGEFVLHDVSTNGTYVETEDLGQLKLLKQKVYLYGTGIFSPGVPINAKTATPIRFICS